MHGRRIKKNRPRQRIARHYTTHTLVPDTEAVDAAAVTDAAVDTTTILIEDWRRHHETLTTLTHPRRDRAALIAAAGAILAIEETLRGLGYPPPGGSWMSDKAS